MDVNNNKWITELSNSIVQSVSINGVGYTYDFKYNCNHCKKLNQFPNPSCIGITFDCQHCHQIISLNKAPPGSELCDLCKKQYVFNGPICSCFLK